LRKTTVLLALLTKTETKLRIDNRDWNMCARGVIRIWIHVIVHMHIRIRDIILVKYRRQPTRGLLSLQLARINTACSREKLKLYISRNMPSMWACQYVVLTSITGFVVRSTNNYTTYMSLCSIWYASWEKKKTIKLLR
jgi:hypothetical protein